MNGDFPAGWSQLLLAWRFPWDIPDEHGLLALRISVISMIFPYWENPLEKRVLDIENIDKYCLFFGGGVPEAIHKKGDMWPVVVIFGHVLWFDVQGGAPQL